MHADLQIFFAEYERLKDSLSTDATRVSASPLECSQFAVENFEFYNLLNANCERPLALMG